MQPVWSRGSASSSWPLQVESLSEERELLKESTGSRGRERGHWFTGPLYMCVSYAICKLCDLFRDIKIRILRPRFGQNLAPWIFLQPKSWFCIRSLDYSESISALNRAVDHVSANEAAATNLRQNQDFGWRKIQGARFWPNRGRRIRILMSRNEIRKK